MLRWDPSVLEGMRHFWTCLFICGSAGSRLRDGVGEGGEEAWSPKHFFRPFGPQVWSKNKGGARAPPLDPPLYSKMTCCVFWPVGCDCKLHLLDRREGPCKQSFLLSSWVRRRKRDSAWFASTLWSSRSSNLLTSQSCFYSSNWLFLSACIRLLITAIRPGF